MPILWAPKAICIREYRWSLWWFQFRKWDAKNGAWSSTTYKPLLRLQSICWALCRCLPKELWIPSASSSNVQCIWPKGEPRQSDSHFQQAIRNEPFTIAGDGSQLRSFMHVSDVCAAISGLLSKGTLGQIYNIGSTLEISLGKRNQEDSRCCPGEKGICHWSCPHGRQAIQRAAILRGCRQAEICHWLEADKIFPWRFERDHILVSLEQCRRAWSRKDPYNIIIMVWIVG